MSKISAVDQALLDLQRVQTKILVLSHAGIYTSDEATELEQTIDASVKTIRRTLARTAQALRGELNEPAAGSD